MYSINKINGGTKRFTLFLVIVVIGIFLINCASTTSVQLGQTLEETLGIKLVELEEMFGKNRTEIEHLIGSRLSRGDDSDTWIAVNYPIGHPNAGIEETEFEFDDGELVNIYIWFNGRKNVFNDVVAQTTEIFGNPERFSDVFLWDYNEEILICCNFNKEVFCWNIGR